MWSCACDAFLLSRFLICKHIIYCFDPITDPVEFFTKVCRQRSSPFWVHGQLIFRPEYNELGIRKESDANSDSESDIDPEALDEDVLVMIEDEPTPQINTEEFVSIMGSAMQIFHEQEAVGNMKFVEAFIASNGMNRTLIEEIQRLKSRQTMPMTWSRNKHPATMYYR